MAKPDKTEIEEEIPVFRNRTKIDQIVYDESYSPITIPSGKTIRGKWYKRYAGKGGPLRVVTGKEREKEDDKDERSTEGEGKK